MKQPLTARPPLGSMVGLIKDSSYLYDYHGAKAGSIGIVRRYSHLQKDGSDMGLLVDWGRGREVRMSLDEVYLASTPRTPEKPIHQRIIETLEDHMFNHRGKCECGVSVQGTKYDSPAELTRTHFANVLLPLIEEVKAMGWDAAKASLRDIPYWYAGPDKHGFDIWEDDLGIAQESGARIEVMKILDKNPYRETDPS